MVRKKREQKRIKLHFLQLIQMFLQEQKTVCSQNTKTENTVSRLSWGAQGMCPGGVRCDGRHRVTCAFCVENPGYRGAPWCHMGESCQKHLRCIMCLLWNWSSITAHSETFAMLSHFMTSTLSHKLPRGSQPIIYESILDSVAFFFLKVKLTRWHLSVTPKPLRGLTFFREPKDKLFLMV